MVLQPLLDAQHSPVKGFSMLLRCSNNAWYPLSEVSTCCRRPATAVPPLPCCCGCRGHLQLVASPPSAKRRRLVLLQCWGPLPHQSLSMYGHPQGPCRGRALLSTRWPHQGRTPAPYGGPGRTGWTGSFAPGERSAWGPPGGLGRSMAAPCP